MGSGHGYICSKCGNEYEVLLGVGMRTYETTIDKIKNGVYGNEWKDIFSSQEYMAVDAEKNLYTCKCGNWTVEHSLSLYAPKEPDKIPDKQYGIKTVKEWGYVPYVMKYDLDNDYYCIKHYIHRCQKCGSEMQKTDTKTIHSLPCPECGNINSISSFVNWD